MKKPHPILASYIPVVEGLARTFGEFCEVVLHDLRELPSTIIAIHHGHVSGRSLDAPITNLGLKILRSGKHHQDFILNYENKSVKDKMIKSSSIFIKDENQQEIGCLCINLDVTHLTMAETMLKSINSISQHEGQASTEESFATTISGLMEQIIEECIKKIGKPIPLMQKEEKMSFISLLDEAGLFQIKGAVQQIAELLSVSKYTIYNYIEKIEKNANRV
ncbi:hypothetical protein ELQ35_20650 [Peribacillus cavernae]|uniref:Transcriptional regulator n=1 Tax=Peribacillus cavernae TaxID=1674310 RepID=A0A433HA27_9BACI|nr:PAS domain-containing protein [Peribacillus cavernae]MDQ0219773.1 putative transcriptional regulator YheO [Peribacillus cavernae]RUQ25189.1 hypothetical protein ELQ35_20650 [Peribacillus cavernae]